MAEERKRGFFSRFFGADGEADPETGDSVLPEGGQAPAGEPEPKELAPEREAARPSAQAGLEQLPTEAVIVPPPSFPAQSAEPAQAPPSSAAAEPASWFQRLRTGLSRSSNALSSGITGVFTQRKLDRETLQDLEDLLIQADLGVETAAAIADALSRDRFDHAVSLDKVRAVMAGEIERVLAPTAQPLSVAADKKPFVILMVGVNGSGKTTTIGKLAAKFRTAGHSVMLAAGDTFRAAAIEQLKIWGERSGAPVVARSAGSDAAGLAFDAMVEARKAGAHILMIDTAGRLQNRTELMAELAKMVRVIQKHDPSAPHAVLLTLDATTGQNAMNQVEVFAREAGVTGLVMTKLDGTARGGILVAIAARHRLPVHYIGVGESIHDLEAFSARDFARAIAGLEK